MPIHKTVPVLRYSSFKHGLTASFRRTILRVSQFFAVCCRRASGLSRSCLSLIKAMRTHFYRWVLDAEDDGGGLQRDLF